MRERGKCVREKEKFEGKRKVEGKGMVEGKEGKASGKKKGAEEIR